MRRRALLSGNGGNIDYSEQYLTFRSITDCTHKFTNQLEYSTNNGRSWSTLAANTGLRVAAGKCVMWKAELTPSSNGIGTFSSSGKFNAEGNPMSLLFSDNFKGQTSLSGKNYALCVLFKNNSNIIGAENMSLPATTLENGCYQGMFQGCKLLTTAPELPATKLDWYCYENMFSGCTNLTAAPELPATKLVSYCYRGMFLNCTSLTTAHELPAATLASGCYQYMFQSCTRLNSITCLATKISAYSCTTNWVSGVASSGTFTKASRMKSWTTGDNGIPSGWTVKNK